MAKQYIRDFVYAEAMALGASANGNAWNSEAIYSPFIQVTVSGATTLDTDLEVEGTNDINSGNNQPQNWVKLSEFASKNLTADGTTYWWLKDSMIPFLWLRVVNTNTAGTGTARIVIGGVRL